MPHIRRSHTVPILILWTVVANSDGVLGQSRATSESDRPMAKVVDDPQLPRVLLIGDSISIGYTVPTRKLLRGKANVHRPLTNCGPTTKGLKEIDSWLGEGKWDVIHFNWGLHDLKYMGPKGQNLAEPKDPTSKPQVPLDEYEANLDKLVQRLKKTGAKLIWRNTTPVPPGAKGRVVGDAAKYNAAAARVMKKHNIPIQDLFTFSKQRMDKIMRKANVHFTPQGSEALAAEVARVIQESLAEADGKTVVGATETRGVETRFRLVDGETGALVPAVICIQDLADQSVRLPPDGRVMNRVGHTQEFYQGIEYDADDPNWIGPIRKTMGKGDNNDRSYVYDQLPSIPFWREPVLYQVQPEFTIHLPPGRYRISTARGMEYIPVRKEFSVAGKTPQQLTVQLRRWVDLPALGWYSGDVHVHHPTTKKAHRQFLLRYAEAEDLHVVNVLEMGHHRGTDFKQAGFGRKFRQQRGEYWLVSGQEEPRSTFGHVIGLNTNALARDLGTYDLYDLAFQRLHDQPNAVVGFAHFSWNGCNLPRGFPWYVTTEGIDFVELLQFSRINRLDYYDYLNLGFRLSAAAGSDIPWGSSLGEVRTYVHTGDALDVDRWFAGLEVGRTFVSNGPALQFHINGQLAGSEIKFDKAGTLQIQARAWGHPGVGVPEELELVSNKGVIKRVRRAMGDPRGNSELSINATVDVERSQWFAIHTRCDNGAVAHSSPIYVVVAGEPTWSPQKAEEIVKKQLDAIASIDREFQDGTDIRSRAIRQRLERARVYYGKLLAAAK